MKPNKNLSPDEMAIQAADMVMLGVYFDIEARISVPTRVRPELWGMRHTLLSSVGGLTVAAREAITVQIRIPM